MKTMIILYIYEFNLFDQLNLPSTMFISLFLSPKSIVKRNYTIAPTGEEKFKIIIDISEVPPLLDANPDGPTLTDFNQQASIISSINRLINYACNINDIKNIGVTYDHFQVVETPRNMIMLTFKNSAGNWESAEGKEFIYLMVTAADRFVRVLHDREARMEFLDLIYSEIAGKTEDMERIFAYWIHEATTNKTEIKIEEVCKWIHRSPEIPGTALIVFQPPSVFKPKDLC